MRAPSGRIRGRLGSGQDRPRRDDDLDALETRLRDMNRMARVVERKRMYRRPGMNLSAFDLDQVLERRPTFLGRCPFGGQASMRSNWSLPAERPGP